MSLSPKILSPLCLRHMASLGCLIAVSLTFHVTPSLEFYIAFLFSLPYIGNSSARRAGRYREARMKSELMLITEPRFTVFIIFQDHSYYLKLVQGSPSLRQIVSASRTCRFFNLPCPSDFLYLAHIAVLFLTPPHAF